MRLSRVPLSELTIEDEASFRHVSLFHDLRAALERSDATFLVPAEGGLSWDRALLLNLLYWEPNTSDVLTSRSIPADVMMHVAWHHLGDRHVQPSVEGHLLVESIASAFDVYLVGRLLGHAPDSEFLGSQVPRMSEIAQENGLSEEGFEALLEGFAKEPERGFESLRQLLFDASVALIEDMSAEAGCAVLERFDAHPYGALLHHFELPTWVLRARLERARATVQVEGREDARALDQKLREESDSLAWLEQSWLGSAGGAAKTTTAQEPRGRGRR